MISLQTNKWGRAAFAAGMTILLLLLSSCGTDETGSSAEFSETKPDISSVNSIDNTDTASLDPIERLSGLFYIDGDRSAASVAIETDGSFTTYYASGTAEQQGSVRYETDASGFHVYVFYTDEGKPYMGFVDSGESKISAFETGNGSYRYVRVE